MIRGEGSCCTNANRINRYANKQVYRGPLKNGCPHGIGSLHIPQVEFLHARDLVLTMYRQWQEGTVACLKP